MIDNIYQVKVENCVICGSKEQVIKHYFPPNRYDHSVFITHSWDGGLNIGLTIVACGSCGFLYQSPVFKYEYLPFLYPTSIIPKKLLASEINFYREDHFINQVRPYFEKLHNPFAVDIGTRYGQLPMRLRELGIESVGIDFNSACVEASRNFGFEHVYNYSIKDLPELIKLYNRKSINLITMIDVIEHLTMPSEDFSLLSSLQNQGDVFMATTMFTDSAGYWLFGKEWYYIHAQHTLYFSKSTIKKFLLRYGYEVKEMMYIPLYKNATIILEETIRYIKHKMEMHSHIQSKSKKWFAENRPHCFDLMTVIAIKK